MELVSCHNHTAYCGHAEGSVLDVARAAHEAGVSVLAFTEHYPLTEAADPLRDNAILHEELPQYFADIQQVRAAYPSMQVVTGMEIDWLGAKEDRLITDETFAPFAYTLLSVHFLDGWGFDDDRYLEPWHELGADEVWRRYGETWLEAVESAWPCTAMAHPDLVKKFGFRPSYPLDALYDNMVQATRESGRMIELNTAGLFYDCKEEYPAPELLRQFCRAGVPCCVGSDAHKPSQVVRGIEQAYRLLYEAGYREVTVPTPDGDRRAIPID